jgi:endogenous inhibitor of DNA gyrase (YacG/DUF329 family)
VIASRSGSPSRHDGVTTPCPACQRPFTPAGRRIFCSGACRALAYRRRRDAERAAIVIPAPLPARPVTIYECGTCGHRELGNQRCDQCGTFMRRTGTGGSCPACDAPITIAELTGQEART